MPIVNSGRPSRRGNQKRAGAARVTPASASTAESAGSAAAAGTAGSPSGRAGKFNAKGEHVNGKWMASEAEAERYRQLLRMEMNGMIDNLRTQVTHRLVVNNVLICSYRSDFEYDVVEDGGRTITRSIIEDIKGFVTPEFTIKEKLFNALEPIPLTVIKPGQVKGSRAEYMRKHWADRLPA